MNVPHLHIHMLCLLFIRSKQTLGSKTRCSRRGIIWTAIYMHFQMNSSNNTRCTLLSIICSCISEISTGFINSPAIWCIIFQLVKRFRYKIHYVNGAWATNWSGDLDDKKSFFVFIWKYWKLIKTVKNIYIKLVARLHRFKCVLRCNWLSLI